MGNIFRLSVIFLNLILYKLTGIENIDIFVSNIITLNLLTFCLFIFFDDFKSRNVIIDKVGKNKGLKEIIFIGLKKQFKNIFNWVVFLFPLTFYSISNLNHTFSQKEIVFYLVILIFLLVNIIVLSTLIKIEYHKKYFIYIIVTGVLFQIYTSFFSSSFKGNTIFLIGLILLTYLSILFFSYSYSKKRNQVSS